MKRRRAGGSARRGAHRMCASFPPVHGRTVGKPRRSDANPRAARALHPGRLSLGYLSLATQRKVTRTPKADETGRETTTQSRIPSSHRDRSPRIKLRDARMNPRGRAFRRSYMSDIDVNRMPKADEQPASKEEPELASRPTTKNRNRRRENEAPRSRLPTLLQGRSKWIECRTANLTPVQLSPRPSNANAPATNCRARRP